MSEITELMPVVPWCWMLIQGIAPEICIALAQ